MRLKILSLNWHEPYLCHLARIGHKFLHALDPKHDSAREMLDSIRSDVVLSK
jgi:hypothetical protein